MKNNPLVSICIPAYNAEKYIAETIYSILDQSYSLFEIIIVDDNSTDATGLIITQFNNTRIKLFKAEGQGAAAARNQAYSYAQGEFIIFLDADDLLSKHFIKYQVEALNNRTDCIAISYWGRFYQSKNEDFHLVEDSITYPHTLEEWIVINWLNNKHNTPPGRLLIHRQIIEKAGLWNVQLNLNDDFEFFTRVAIHAKLLIPNKHSVYYYRSGINGLSSKKGYLAYRSLFTSLNLAFNLVLSVYTDNRLVKTACANLWQAFIFEVYPLLKHERLIAEQNISKLEGSTLKYPAGGLTQRLIKVVNWKIVKRINIILRKR